MGASYTDQVAAGRTPNEAYARAVADAADEYGHQDGYSGALNSKGGGFVLVPLPARLSVAKFVDLLEAASYDEIRDLEESISWRKGILDRSACKRSERPAVRKAMQADERALKQARREKAKRDDLLARVGISEAAFDRYARDFNDKWGAALAVELRGADAKRYASRVSKRRGEKLYLFFGYAPS